MNNQIPITYLRDCKKELEYTLSILNEGIEKEFLLAQLFYEDEIESINLPVNFIIPVPSSSYTFYQNTLGKITTIYPIKLSQAELMSYIVEYLKWVNSILSTEIYDYASIDRFNTKQMNLKKFKRGELKPLLEKLAIEYKLVKYETFSKNILEVICNDLTKRGYLVNKSSVASTLRDKLDYSTPKKRR